MRMTPAMRSCSDCAAWRAGSLGPHDNHGATVGIGARADGRYCLDRPSRGGIDAALCRLPSWCSGSLNGLHK